TRALATSDLVGMQPLLTQVPPRWARSTSRVALPAAAKRAARKGPDWPAPMKIASKALGMVRFSPGLTTAGWRWRAGRRLTGTRPKIAAAIRADAAGFGLTVRPLVGSKSAARLQ